MTSTDTTRHADPVTMTLFHSALERDLERASVLLRDPQRLSLRRTRQLGRHLLWVLGALRWHHEGEDHYLWPLLLEREPGSGAVLEAMEAEHDAIDEPLLRLEAAARGLVAGRTDPSDVLVALAALQPPLLDHLSHEEGEGLDIVGRVLSQEEWKDFEQRAWIDGYTAAESVRFLQWMCDGVDWQESLRRRLGLPRPLLWSVVRPLSSLATVPGLSVWAGTPAARIRGRRM